MKNNIDAIIREGLSPNIKKKKSSKLNNLIKEGLLGMVGISMIGNGITSNGRSYTEQQNEEDNSINEHLGTLASFLDTNSNKIKIQPNGAYLFEKRCFRVANYGSTEFKTLYESNKWNLLNGYDNIYLFEEIAGMQEPQVARGITSDNEIKETEEFNDSEPQTDCHSILTNLINDIRGFVLQNGLNQYQMEEKIKEFLTKAEMESGLGSY